MTQDEMLETIQYVKENVHSYESTSLANDDVVRLLGVIRELLMEEV